MGVTWIADVLSWAFGGSYYYWIVTDLINVLQGVFIFLVIACQPHVSLVFIQIDWIQLKCSTSFSPGFCCRQTILELKKPSNDDDWNSRTAKLELIITGHSLWWWTDVDTEQNSNGNIKLNHVKCPLSNQLHFTHPSCVWYFPFIFLNVNCVLSDE